MQKAQRKYVNDAPVTHLDIERAYARLEMARLDGDLLKIDLATEALNNLLERYGGHSCHT